MAEQGKFKTTMFLTIWQTNFIGIVFGSWILLSAKDGGPVIVVDWRAALKNCDGHAASTKRTTF